MLSANIHIIYFLFNNSHFDDRKKDLIIYLLDIQKERKTDFIPLEVLDLMCKEKK